MTRPGAILRSIDVAVDPQTAFDAFTAEIGLWYRSLPFAWNDPARAVGIRFEPRVGGRWLEVWDEATGEGYEIGRILAWEPGARLVTTYRNIYLPPEPLTEIEVRFDAIGKGTRVSLEHRGWDRLPLEVFTTWSGRAWLALFHAYQDYLATR